MIRNMLGWDQYFPHNNFLKSVNYNRTGGYGEISEGREGPLNHLQMSWNFTRCNILLQRNFLGGETLQFQKFHFSGTP